MAEENGGQGWNRSSDTGIFRGSQINNLLIGSSSKNQAVYRPHADTSHIAKSKVLQTSFSDSLLISYNSRITNAEIYFDDLRMSIRPS